MGPRRVAVAVRRARGARVPGRDRDGAAPRRATTANLTQTPGAHERGPAWSPDGKEIAWVSDESGEYELVVSPQDGKGAEEDRCPSGAGFYDRLAWSPDWKKIGFTDNSHEPLGRRRRDRRAEEGRERAALRPGRRSSTTLVARLPLGRLHARQARPTSDASRLRRRGREVVPADRRPLRRSDPVFDKGGKHIWFLASTDAGPVRDWFSQANAGRATRATDLRRHAPKAGAVARSRRRATRRRARRGEGSRRSRTEKDEAGKATAKAPSEPKKDAKKPVERRSTPRASTASGSSPCRMAGLRRSRARPRPTALLPTRPASRRPRRGRRRLPLRPGEAQGRDDRSRKADGYGSHSTDKKLLIRVKESWSVGRTSATSSTSRREAEGRTRSRCASTRAPSGPQIFDEVWRINRDCFYDPGDARRDWKAMKAKYARLPARPLLARRPLPPHPVDAAASWRSATPPVARRQRLRGQDGPGRPPRGRLRGRERPLPLQEGLRRPELEPRPARAAHRAGRRGEGGRVPARREGQGPRASPTTSTRASSDRRKDRRDHRRPDARREGLAHREGGAARGRAGAAQPRLGRGEPRGG